MSPRRLIKQVALESPPHIPELEEHSAFYRHIHQENRSTCSILTNFAINDAVLSVAEDTIHNQRQRMRKASHFVMSSQPYSENQCKPGSWSGPPFSNWLDLDSQQSYHANADLKQSSFRVGDECVSDRLVIKQYYYLSVFPE